MIGHFGLLSNVLTEFDLYIDIVANLSTSRWIRLLTRVWRKMGRGKQEETQMVLFG